MLEDELEWSVDPALLGAYRKYEAALVLLDDVYAAIEGVSKTSRASEAMPLLDEAASYVLQAAGDAVRAASPAATFARVTAANAAARTDWLGSRWRESFYRTEMAFAAREREANGAGAGASSGGEGVELRAGYGQTVLEWPNGARQLGSLEGVASGTRFEGTWREERAGSGDEPVSVVTGVVELEMAPDGLSFEGRARAGDEVWRWEGERIPDPPPVRGPGSERERWGARVLVERSRARLRLGQGTEALRDAVSALGLCALPEVWDAIATAALEVGDKRTATMALGEQWFGQGPTSVSMPAALANRRREQRLALEGLAGGGGGIILQALSDGRQVATDRAAASDRAAGAEPEAEGDVRGADEAEEDPALAAAMRAIFVDGYVLPGEEGDP